MFKQSASVPVSEREAQLIDRVKRMEVSRRRAFDRWIECRTDSAHSEFDAARRYSIGAVNALNDYREVL